MSTTMPEQNIEKHDDDTLFKIRFDCYKQWEKMDVGFLVRQRPLNSH